MSDMGMGVDPLNRSLLPVVPNLLGFNPEENDNQDR